MSVSYTSAKVIYEGNGQTAQWDIPFPYISDEDLQLYLVEADGTQQALEADFTIDSDLNAVLYPMPDSQTPLLQSGQKLMILRRTPLTQQTEFEEQQAIDPFVLEEGYDKAIMIAQEQAEELTRAIKFPASCSNVQTNAQSYLSQITGGVRAAQFSAQAAQTSADNAAQSATDASAEADRSAWNADNAQQAQINAAVSYNQAKQAAESASSSAASAVSKAAEAQTASTSAQTSLTAAQQSAQAAAASAAEAQGALQAHNSNAQAHADIRSTLSGKAEQTALVAHTARTDNPHAVTKAQVGLGDVDNTSDMNKPVSTAAQAALDLKANSAEVDADISDINAALERKQDDDEFHPEDYGWPDIRPAARPNAVVLLAGVKSDYSAYDNLGFKATCTGGYNVFIDGVQYGQTYASAAQCSITWSQYSATTGFSVTQPEALMAHIVQIVPAVTGNTITEFQMERGAASGAEAQGLLWLHLTTQTALPFGSVSVSGQYSNNLLKAISSVQNSLKIGNSNNTFYGTAGLAYLPECDMAESINPGILSFVMDSALKKITLANRKVTGSLYRAFAGCVKLEEIILKNASLCPSEIYQTFTNCQALKRLPPIDFSQVTSAYQFLYNGYSLKDLVLDLSYAHLLQVFHFYNTPGLKGLIVSPQAPFDYTTAPQINVSNTGLDTNALVALFNSLPQVTAGQVINITGATGAASLTAEQLAIATNKGWTVTR